MCLGAQIGETRAGEGGTVVAHSTVVTASHRACGKIGRKGKRGQRSSSPQGGAPATARGNKRVARQRRRQRPGCSGEGGAG
jgi:hypothetical protein